MRGGTGPPRLTRADLGERSVRPEAPVHFRGRERENGTNSDNKCCLGAVVAGCIPGGGADHDTVTGLWHPTSPHAHWH